MAVVAEGAIDLSRLLDERAISPLQALVAALSGLIMLVDGYDIQVMALAVPAIAKEWSIAPSHFGLALSAALLGLSVGAAFIAPLGDRLGRRTLLIGAMAVVGATTMATSTAASPMQFVAWRFVTGVGLGVSIPNCNAWTAEYVPIRNRATILVVMNAAIGAGAFCAGFVAPLIFAHWGWRGAFVIGGASPLLIGLAILAAAPESLKFLALRRPHDPRIPRILARIAPDIDFEAIDPTADLRDEADIDSMDFLNLLTGLHARLGVEIPEADIAKLITVQGAIDYLAGKLNVAG